MRFLFLAFLAASCCTAKPVKSAPPEKQAALKCPKIQQRYNAAGKKVCWEPKKG